MSLDSIFNFALITESSYREVFWKRDCSVTLVKNFKKWLSARSFFGKVESWNFFAGFFWWLCPDFKQFLWLLNIYRTALSFFSTTLDGCFWLAIRYTCKNCVGLQYVIHVEANFINLCIWQNPMATIEDSVRTKISP